jgi:phage terminase large subunit-like protein
MRQPNLYGQLKNALASSWRLKARPEQLPPKGDRWNGWLFVGGRGAGKTRTGSEFICEEVETRRVRRIALVAPTAHDARHVMLEGESGILTICSAVESPRLRAESAPVVMEERRRGIHVFVRRS